MKIILETKRLLIRQFNNNDFSNLCALDSDPEVMRYISDGKTMTEEQTKVALTRIIARADEWKTYGIWAAELKSTGEFIGWFALKPLPGTSEIEIGYRLLKKHWNKGHATEGTKKIIEYSFQVLGLKKVVAITNPNNQASKKVLEKSGLKYFDDIEYQSSPASPKQHVSWFTITS